MGAVAARWNERVCVFGGFDAANEPLSSVDCFDIATGRRTPAARMPTARGLSAAAPSQRGIHVIGGTRKGPDKLATVELYEPNTDTWTPASALPTPRNALSAVTLGDEIFVIGGWGVDADDRALDFATVEILDTRRGEWSTGTPLPMGRSHMAVAVAGRRIYAFGGWIRRAGVVTALADSSVYDPETARWSRAPDLPTPRWLASAAVVDDRIFVLGGWVVGESGRPTATDRVEVFDPKTGLWAAGPPLPLPRAGHTGVADGDRILLVGGASTWPPTDDDAALSEALSRYRPPTFAALTPIAPQSAPVTPRSASSTAEHREDGVYGRIVEIVRPFGNLRTSFVASDLEQVGLSIGDSLIIHIGELTLPVTLGKDFSDVAREEWVAFVGPDGTVTLARNFASAAESCACETGDEIVLALDDRPTESDRD